MEGDDVTEPIPGSIRLDDPEKLFRESVQESFSWWRPRALLRLNGPAISDLATHRWYSRSPTPELEVIRRVQARKGMAYDELLARYHRTVLKVADGHMPRYWRARQSSLRDKHTNTLFYQDLVAAGVATMWKAALKFDSGAGYRFWTGVRAPVLGAISDEARLWRRGGSGESRLDRWLYTHPTASPEQVLANQDRLYRVEERLARWMSEHPLASPKEILKKRERINRLLPFHSLHEAAEGIKQFWAWGRITQFRDGAEIDFDEDTEPTGPLIGMYSCFSRYTLSPQLEIHERFSLLVDRLSGGLDTGPDVGNAGKPKAPRDLDDYTETAVVRFKNGKRHVTRQKAPSGYRQLLVDFLAGKYPDNPAPRPPNERLIPVTAELQARAKEDLEFAVRRWQLRTRRGPMPAKQYSRWSTIGGLGRAEDENRQIIPAYVSITRFTWKVEYRGAEGNILSELESPSWHCRYFENPRSKSREQPCEFCEKVRGRSRTHNVALPPLLPRRTLDRRHAMEPRSANPRTKPRTAETRT